MKKIVMSMVFFVVTGLNNCLVIYEGVEIYYKINFGKNF